MFPFHIAEVAAIECGKLNTEQIDKFANWVQDQCILGFRSGKLKELLQPPNMTREEADLLYKNNDHPLHHTIQAWLIKYLLDPTYIEQP